MSVILHFLLNVPNGRYVIILCIIGHRFFVFFFQGARGPNGSVGEKVKNEKEKISPPFSCLSGFSIIELLG